MARVTVEDCVIIVPNRFELCLIANNRAKSILSGSPTSLDEKEKPSVIALREIAEGLIDVDKIRNNIVDSTKNRSLLADGTSMDADSKQIMSEELETNTPPLSDNIFLEDNMVVDD